MAEESKPKNASDLAIEGVEKLIAAGLVLPADYNYVNAIKTAYIQICGTYDKTSGKSLIEICTPASVQTALFLMAKDGLDASKGQCYFSKKGNILKYDKEYHGVTLRVQRIFPNYTPCPKVVYEGDEFAYTTDPATGRRKLVKHEQSLANLDNGFVGAYLYIPCKDGGSDLYVMTRKMILTAWAQSRQGTSVHDKFTDKMVCKTIINSALDPLLKGSTDNTIVVEETEPEAVVEDVVFSDNVAELPE